MAELNFDLKLKKLKEDITKSLNELELESYTGTPNKILAGYLTDQVLVYSKLLSDIRKELTEEEETVVEIDSHSTPIV